MILRGERQMKDALNQPLAHHQPLACTQSATQSATVCACPDPITLPALASDLNLSLIPRTLGQYTSAHPEWLLALYLSNIPATEHPNGASVRASPVPWLHRLMWRPLALSFARSPPVGTPRLPWPRLPWPQLCLLLRCTRLRCAAREECSARDSSHSQEQQGCRPQCCSSGPTVAPNTAGQRSTGGPASTWPLREDTRLRTARMMQQERSWALGCRLRAPRTACRTRRALWRRSCSRWSWSGPSLALGLWQRAV